ncbi:unnamed protein product [Cunninghamella echinulata]
MNSIIDGLTVYRITSSKAVSFRVWCSTFGPRRKLWVRRLLKIGEMPEDRNIAGKTQCTNTAVRWHAGEDNLVTAIFKLIKMKIAVILPSVSGKTTLCKEYSNFLEDIDELPNDNENAN